MVQSNQSMIFNMLQDNIGKMVDFYHFTTGLPLWRATGGEGKVTANIVLRSVVRDGHDRSTYTVIAGLRHILPAIAEFRFTAEVIDFLRDMQMFPEDYLAWLQGRGFDCAVSLVPDGVPVFPGVIGRISGDPVMVKFLDSIIMDFLRTGSSVATKAARLDWAAGGEIIVIDNALRRSNDTCGLITAETACIAGAAGTSNVAAAMEFGLKASGTMDHWYMMTMMALKFEQSVPMEKLHDEAYAAYIREFPNGGAFLLDTIGTGVGLQSAIRALKGAQNVNLAGYAIRIDSGDLLSTSKWVRQQLNAAGLGMVKILVSGGLRAVNLATLRKKEAPIDGVGIGGYFQFGAEQNGNPFETPVNVEIVAKAGLLERADGEAFDLIKMSDTKGKSSLPGIQDLLHLYDEEGRLSASVTVPFGYQLGYTWVSSVRTGTLEVKEFALDNFQRPIQALVAGPTYFGEDVLNSQASSARFERWFPTLKGPEGLEDRYYEVDGSHSDAPAGIEQGLFERRKTMEENSQIVAPVGA